MLEINVIIAYIFGIFLVYLLGRIFLLPIKIIFKLIYNGLIGGLTLWTVNFIGSFFAFSIAINVVTALIAGFLGLPGVLLLVILKMFVA